MLIGSEFFKWILMGMPSLQCYLTMIFTSSARRPLSARRPWDVYNPLWALKTFSSSSQTGT